MSTIRVACSLSPEKDLWREIVTASQEISDEYQNGNEIDDEQYPPHLSMHICTIPTTSVDELQVALTALWAESPVVALNVAEVAIASGGYIMANIERSDDLLALHQSIIDKCADARTPLRADGATESNADRYGSAYVLDMFQPHLSIAKVDFEDQTDALAVAKQYVKTQSTKAAALQLVEIGDDSSKWDIIWSS